MKHFKHNFIGILTVFAGCNNFDTGTFQPAGVEITPAQKITGCLQMRFRIGSVIVEIRLNNRIGLPIISENR